MVVRERADPGVKRKVPKPQIVVYNRARKLLATSYLMPIQNSTAVNEQSHPGFTKPVGTGPV